MPKFWESLLFRTIMFVPTFILFIPIRLALSVVQIVLSVVREVMILMVDTYHDSLDFWEVAEHLANEWRGHGQKS